MSTKSTQSESLRRNMELLKKRSFDVKFDLESSGYEAVENIGIGAYGVVCSAFNKKTKQKVAIKKIPNVFEVTTIAMRTFREIKILKHFKHDNIISIREILKPKEKIQDFKDVYVVLDLMESDLHRIIYSKQELTDEHVRYFLYQILRGLKYIHSANVIHRDLKPSNLLVNEDCQLSIGDFGMARGVISSEKNPNLIMTQYVATRWYRAPELMMNMLEYSTSVDMWSVGCIFAEMLRRHHLFPGADYIQQMKLIIGVLGTPPDSFLKLSVSDIIRQFIKGLKKRDPVPLSLICPTASKKALDLLGKMLLMNPQDRITVEKALKHPYLSKYHDPDDEPICVPSFEFSFEDKKMSMNDLRDSIYKEIMEYHKPKVSSLSFQAVLRPAPKNSVPTSPNVSSNKQDFSSITSSLDEFLQELTSKSSQKLQNKAEIIRRDNNTENTDIEEKVRPVSIDIGSLQAESTDIEMLSAKQNGGKAVPFQSKDPKNKTVSMDTKAALLNIIRRPRADSCGKEGDATRRRPVTAAQRQKEREDKRKKVKMNRAKGKEKAPASFGLSNEDKEMLLRWSKMHPVVPNAQDGAAKNADSKENIPISKISPSKQPQTSVLKKDSNESLKDQRVPSQQDMSESGSKMFGNHANSTAVPDVSRSPDSNTQGQNIFSTINMNSLKLMGLVNVDADPNKKMTNSMSSVDVNDAAVRQNLPNFHPSVNNPESNQGTTVPGLQPTLPAKPAIVLNPSASSSPSLDLQDTMLNIIEGNAADPISKYQSIAETFPIQNAVFNNAPTNLIFDNRTSNSQQIQQNHTGPEFQSTLMANSIDSNSFGGPIIGGATNPNNLEPIHDFHIMNKGQLNIGQQLENGTYLMKGSASNVDRMQNQNGTSSSQLPSFTNQQQGTVKQLPTYTVQHQPSDVANQMPVYNVNQHPSETNAQIPTFSVEPQRFGTANQMSAYTTEHPAVDPSTQLPSYAQATNPTRRQFETYCNVTTQPDDLVAMLTKKFSKSQVEDTAPPSLALTPRGTGGGYGVGLDLDSLMLDSLDSETARSELSPLSSSLLRDWMDLSENGLVDIEALEQEFQSPMALSFNDFSLYPS